MSTSRRSDAIALTILALVPTLLFLDVFLGSGSLYVRDVVHYHYPGKLMLREILLSGHFPWWNPNIHAGQPLAANPAYQLFYPLNALILLPSYHLGFHLLALSHVYIASFAMYALLRSMRSGAVAATIGGLSFGIGGLVLSTLNVWPYLFSIAWLPLTLLFARRFLIERKPRDFALAAVFWGLQLIVGEPTAVVQTGLLLGLYAIHRGWRKEVVRNVAFVGALAIAALLVAAIQVLPGVDHFRDSVRRRGLEWSIVKTWSMPPARVAELFFPNFLGHPPAGDLLPYWGHELYPGRDAPFFFSIYSGLLVTALAAAGAIARQRGTALFLTICGVAMLLAVGDHTPLLDWLYQAGIAGAIRYPEKFMIMLVVAVVIFGARALDRLLHGDERMRRSAFGVTIGITLIALVGVILTKLPAYEPLHRWLFAVPATDTIAEDLGLVQRHWFLAAARGVLLAILIRNVARMRRAVLAGILGTFVILDLGMGIGDIAPRIPTAFYEEPPAAKKLPRNRDEYRLFHLADWQPQSRIGKPYYTRQQHRYWLLRNSLRPMTQATWGFRTVLEVDFDMTALLVTDEFTRSAWALLNRDMRYVNEISAMSNMWFVGIFRPVDQALKLAGNDVRRVEGVRWVEGHHHPRYYFATQLERARTPEEWVQKILAKKPERYVAYADLTPFPPARGTVRNVREWPNGARIEVETPAQGYLVMSVTPHKYWRVTIDGNETRSLRTNVGFQGVVVPPGPHVVEMRYRNPLVLWGAGITIVTLLGLALSARIIRMRDL
ncbi:MAG TPA: YfhO family protein [Thermoanaerobaculia bacterium]|nr:YfhO family protein [Thermoanaerobaculia bacterium]